MKSAKSASILSRLPGSAGDVPIGQHQRCSRRPVLGCCGCMHQDKTAHTRGWSTMCVSGVGTITSDAVMSLASICTTNYSASVLACHRVSIPYFQPPPPPMHVSKNRRICSFARGRYEKYVSVLLSKRFRPLR